VPKSYSPETVRRIKKKVKLDRMLASFKDDNKVGIMRKANFVFGIPN